MRRGEAQKTNLLFGHFELDLLSLIDALGRREPLHILSLLVLFALGLWILLRKRWRGSWPLSFPKTTTWERGLFFSALFFFALSLPLIYGALVRVVPGLSSMRVPTRGYPFLSLGLAFFASIGLERLLNRLRLWRVVVQGLVPFLLLLELRSLLSWHSLQREDEFPPVFARIAEGDTIKAVLHIPIHPDAREALYMYYSTLHWKPIVNGYSGFFTDQHVEVRRRIREELELEETIDHLIELGVTRVVANPRRYGRRGQRQRLRLRKWEARFTSGAAPRLRLAGRFGGSRLYELLPHPAQAP